MSQWRSQDSEVEGVANALNVRFSFLLSYSSVSLSFSFSFSLLTLRTPPVSFLLSRPLSFSHILGSAAKNRHQEASVFRSAVRPASVRALFVRLLTSIPRDTTCPNLVEISQ